MRSWKALRGSIDVAAVPDGPGLWRIAVTVRNAKPVRKPVARARRRWRRRSAPRPAVLRARRGTFISLTDPPAELQEAAARCANVGVWPVLAGAPGDRSTMLASPIILADHPEIAPEKPGRLLRRGRVDQMLVLNVLALTDEEKAEMRTSDPRAREILERTEALSEEELMAPARDDPRVRAHAAAMSGQRPPWEELERPGPDMVVVDGTEDHRRLARAPRAAARGRCLRRGAGRARQPSSRTVESRHGRRRAARGGRRGRSRAATSACSASPATASSTRPTEVVPLGDDAPPPSPESPRVLVAGIGNVFLGDDGFGVEVATRLAEVRLPAGVHVEDFGIRGMDLAYALAGYDAARC